MTRRLDILVADTSPLITLAMSDALPTLLAPGVRIVIPDAVMFEATRFEHASGASEIIAFTYKHADHVTQQATETGQQQIALLAANQSIRGMGEKAVQEVVREYGNAFPERDMLLLFEDRDMQKQTLILPDRTFAISTGDFLRTLENHGLVESAENVLRKAEQRGRTVERQRRKTSPEASIETLAGHLNR